MSAELITYGADRNLVLGNAEAIRKPIYMNATTVVGAASAATNEITAAAHGLINGAKVLIGGATPPGGTTAGFYYFVVQATTNTFKISATSGGAEIDLTTDGTSWWWHKCTWNIMRIGVRYAFKTPVATITGSPHFAFGVMNGSANGLGAVSSPHMIFTQTNLVNLNYNAGPPAFFNQNAVGSNYGFRKVGGTITGNGTNITAQRWGIGSRTAHFFEVIRTNTSMAFRVGYPGTDAAGQHDLSDAEFQAMMETHSGVASQPLDTAPLAAIVAGYIVNASTLAVNESTNGIFDHLFVYWDRTASKLAFDIKHRLVS